MFIPDVPQEVDRAALAASCTGDSVTAAVAAVLSTAVCCRHLAKHVDILAGANQKCLRVQSTTCEKVLAVLACCAIQQTLYLYSHARTCCPDGQGSWQLWSCDSPLHCFVAHTRTWHTLAVRVHAARIILQSVLALAAQRPSAAVPLRGHHSRDQLLRACKQRVDDGAHVLDHVHRARVRFAFRNLVKHLEAARALV